MQCKQLPGIPDQRPLIGTPAPAARFAPEVNIIVSSSWRRSKRSGRARVPSRSRKPGSAQTNRGRAGRRTRSGAPRRRHRATGRQGRTRSANRNTRPDRAARRFAKPLGGAGQVGRIPGGVLADQSEQGAVFFHLDFGQSAEPAAELRRQRARHRPRRRDLCARSRSDRTRLPPAETHPKSPNRNRRSRACCAEPAEAGRGRCGMRWTARRRRGGSR